VFDDDDDDDQQTNHDGKSKVSRKRIAVGGDVTEEMMY
jgi:hypothetical protein